MMIKLLIVDDEERIRNGLAAMVLSMGLCIEIEGLCGNGIQALEKVREWTGEDCKIMITDIKMPMMDGMKLIEKVNEEAPEIHMILLSGYSEFQYAKHAIRNGVVEYLSKPVNRKELQATLVRIQKKELGGESGDGALADKAEAAVEGEAPKGHRKHAVEEVIRLLESDLKESFDLLALSEKVNLNPSYLSKLFKKETGKTITDYLMEARISKARRILEEYRDVKMYEVGSLVGYPDPMYFNKLFKKHVGMAPKEYQDSLSG
ncbi:response regulator transcription factor [Cohnella lupini]|uniref:Helix-turn-helix protein n=1 Tax=Cohnella lupini TaxID=1294267 RepID=A0A3D9IBQ6_9BACL|nr:response regulator [Cohnella lupini]RED58636.1 helix-turn-helix protein [Cohnella lupini]